MPLREPRKIASPDDLMPDAEYAAIRGVSRKRTSNERCQGIGLPYFKKGQKVFYHRADVLEELNASAVATHTEVAS